MEQNFLGGLEILIAVGHIVVSHANPYRRFRGTSPPPAGWKCKPSVEPTWCDAVKPAMYLSSTLRPFQDRGTCLYTYLSPVVSVITTASHYTNAIRSLPMMNIPVLLCNRGEILDYGRFHTELKAWVNGEKSGSQTLNLKNKQTSWPLVRKRTIPTERPPLVDEI
jgi:hypothetical protein